MWGSSSLALDCTNSCTFIKISLHIIRLVPTVSTCCSITPHIIAFCMMHSDQMHSRTFIYDCIHIMHLRFVILLGAFKVVRSWCTWGET